MRSYLEQKKLERQISEDFEDEIEEEEQKAVEVEKKNELREKLIRGIKERIKR